MFTGVYTSSNASEVLAAMTAVNNIVRARNISERMDVEEGEIGDDYVDNEGKDKVFYFFKKFSAGGLERSQNSNVHSSIFLEGS